MPVTAATKIYKTHHRKKEKYIIEITDNIICTSNAGHRDATKDTEVVTARIKCAVLRKEERLEIEERKGKGFFFI